VIHPANPNILWAGSVGGGVWKTTNAGATWTPLDDFMANLAACCLAIDPANPDVLYCGTGEGFFNADAINGAGIFKTTDGGATWNQLASTASWFSVNRIAISPTKSNIILAATRPGGIQRSTDGGATWTTVRSAQGCLDIAFNPSDSTKAVADILDYDMAHGNWFHSALYSTDAGATWLASNLQGIDGPDNGLGARIELAYAPSSPNIVYANSNSNFDIGCGSSPCAHIGSIFRSTDGGATFVRTSSPSFDTEANWYCNTIWVSPTDPNFIVFGTNSLHRSTDGGATSERITNGYLLTQEPHPDQHFMVSEPGYNGTSNKRLYVCNDGGVFRTDDITTASTTSGWVSLNATYQTAQYYGVGGSSSGLLMGGTQDNGTLKSATGTQDAVVGMGGDGGVTAVDPTNENIWYGEFPGMMLARSTDQGMSFQDIHAGISDSASFVSPFVLDANNTNSLIAGGNSIWRSNDVRTAVSPSWSVIRPPDPSNHAVSALAVAQGNSNIIWAAYSGGELYKTNDGLDSNPVWTTIHNSGQSSTLPSRFLTQILIDPANANAVYVTFGGFTSGNLQKTTDGGATWRDITGSGRTGLPSVPIRSLAKDPTKPNSLFVGTEVGVFASLDGGNTWAAANEGPANVSVDQLIILPHSRTVVAATHGRGLWSTDLSGPLGCAYSLSASTASVTSAGGTGSILLSTDQTCTWTAMSNVNWITLSPASGSGAATIGYPVAANTGDVRTGSITIGSRVITISQSGAITISSVSASGKNLLVTGSNFDSGAAILVNGAPQHTLQGDAPGTLIGKKTLKAVDHGQTVAVQVRNSDGDLSQEVSFTRP
jgi:hypothetical protein